MTGSLLASHTCRSLVTRAPLASEGTNASVQLSVAPLLSENEYFVVLNPPRCEKSLIAATRLDAFFGSTAISSSAAGTLVVACTIDPTLYAGPLIPAGLGVWAALAGPAPFVSICVLTCATCVTKIACRSYGNCSCAWTRVAHQNMLAEMPRNMTAQFAFPAFFTMKTS